jgi:hypothetical protein
VERAKTSACSRSRESDTDCDEKAAIYWGDLQRKAIAGGVPLAYNGNANVYSQYIPSLFLGFAKQG